MSLINFAFVAQLVSCLVSSADKRDDFEPPKLVLSGNIKPVTLENYKGAFERIEPDDIWLEGYMYHEAIKTEMVK